MSADTSALSRRAPGRPQERGESRREALLAALEAELQRHALAEVSIAAVARRAGVARSAFYFYFPSKYAAVAELLVDLYDELVGAMGSELGLTVTPPRESLAVALGHTVSTWRRHRLLLCAMLDASAADPQVRVVWDGWIQLFVDVLLQAARQERWELALPRGVDLRSTLVALLELNQRMLERHVRANGTPADARRLTRLLAHVWTTTLFGPVPS